MGALSKRLAVTGLISPLGSDGQRICTPHDELIDLWLPACSVRVLIVRSNSVAVSRGAISLQCCTAAICLSHTLSPLELTRYFSFSVVRNPVRHGAFINWSSAHATLAALKIRIFNWSHLVLIWESHWVLCLSLQMVHFCLNSNLPPESRSWYELL